MDPESVNIRLVSPIEKYFNSPSSSGFLDVLRGIRDKTICLEEALEDRLDSVSALAHTPTHDSVFTFDADLWAILPSIDLDLCWGMIFDRRNKKGDFSKPGKSEEDHVVSEAKSLQPAVTNTLIDLVGNAISAQQQLNEHIDNVRRETNNSLIFFAEVNSLLSRTDGFDLFVNKSKDLEKLLISLCVSEKAKPQPRTATANIRSWRWISQGVASSYFAHLQKLSSEDVEQSERLVAHGLTLVQASVFYQSALCSGFPASSEIFKSILEWNQGFRSDKGPFNFFTDVLKSIEAGADSENTWVNWAFSLLISGAPAFTRSEFWQFFIASRIANEIELEDGDRETYADEIYYLVKSLVMVSGDLTNRDRSEEIHRRLIGRFSDIVEKFDKDAFVKVLGRYKLGSLPSIDLACFLLREIRDFDRAGVDTDLTHVAQCLVQKINDEFRETGIPPSIPFVHTISDTFEDEGFILKRSVFYESLSTLAINLGEREWDTEHFDYASSSRCFLSATRIVAESGYREHAAVFLAYALLRSALVISDMVDEWSIRELDQTVRSHIDPVFIERYIVPCLGIIRESMSSDKAESPSAVQFRLWSETILGQFGRLTTPVLRLVPAVSQSADATRVPEWFFDGTDDLRECLTRVRIALEVTSPSANEWNQLCRRHRVQEAVDELLKQLESQLILFFSEAHRSFYDNSEFRGAYFSVALSSRLNDKKVDRLSWGWVEEFLKGIAIGNESRERALRLKSLREIANRAVSGLGEALVGINGKTEVVSALRDARELDNHFTSHNAPIRPPEIVSSARGVVQKRVLKRSDCLWVYDYVTVDFSQLFEIIKPIVLIEPKSVGG